MKRFLKTIIALVFLLIVNTTYSQDIIVKTIYFENNSAALDQEGKKIVDEITNILTTSNISYLKIFGFASPSGSEESNLKLSKERANSVYHAIDNQTKIDESNFYMTWLGESADIYDLHFDEAHYQKRCVDILIFKSKEINNH